MNHVLTLMRKLVPALALAAIGLTWSAAVSVLAGPAMLDGIERWGATVLPFEESLRVVIVATLALFVLLWAIRLLAGASTATVVAFASVTVSAACVAFVCANDFDLDHWLGAEYSWIRYPTAGFLIAAGVVSALVAVDYARARERTRTVLFSILGLVFIGLAGDELLTWHEAFGDFIRSHYHATHFATDLVTMAYGVAAIAFVALLLSRPAQAREYLTRHTAAVALFVGATLVFLVGQLGDTFDKDAYKALIDYAAARHAVAGNLFSDFWYPLWAPERLFNDLEEVHECIAASIFFSAFLVLWIDRTRAGLRDRRWFGRPGLSRALTAVVLVVVTAAAAWSARGRASDSPAIGVEARMVMGPADGMYHSDVVVAHPRWGLLVANEGRGTVLRYRDGVAAALPDPEGRVTDTDCVAATDDTLYASSPSLGTVFAYTEAGGWLARFGPEDGLLEPEGLIVVDTTMYVVDETRHLVSVIDLQTGRITDVSLNETPWRWPEGIAWHPGLDRVLITDDIQGDIVTMDRQLVVERFARRAQGLLSPEDVCVTRDGRIFVVDSGRREIMELATDGRIVDRIRFRRMYGYLVGVAVVESDTPGGEDRMYVVSSDGFMRVGFIPSFLWELKLPPRSR